MKTLGASKAQKTWVAFSDDTDLPWLRVLKKGFRHCSVVFNDGSHWITYDPLSSYTDVVVHHVPADFDLPLWLKGRGYTLVPAFVDKTPKASPVMPFTCVEAVKLALGLKRRFIFTPWQLYRYLTGAKFQQTFRETLEKQGDIAWEV